MLTVNNPPRVRTTCKLKQITLRYIIYQWVTCLYIFVRVRYFEVSAAAPEVCYSGSSRYEICVYKFRSVHICNGVLLRLFLLCLLPKTAKPPEICTLKQSPTAVTMVPPMGLEPMRIVPETTALSPELRRHILPVYYTQ